MKGKGDNRGLELGLGLGLGLGFGVGVRVGVRVRVKWNRAVLFDPTFQNLLIQKEGGSSGALSIWMGGWVFRCVSENVDLACVLG